MANLLDIMRPEDRQKVAKWARERRERAKRANIPSGLQLCAKLGYFYGWEAVVDFRRGYHLGLDGHGHWKRLRFSLEDAHALVNAAERLHYQLKLNEGRIHAANSVSAADKNWAKQNAEWVNRLREEI